MKDIKTKVSYLNLRMERMIIRKNYLKRYVEDEKHFDNGERRHLKNVLYKKRKEIRRISREIHIQIKKDPQGKKYHEDNNIEI